MENRKSKFTAFLSSIIAGIIVAMVVYFGLNFAGYKEYRASAKLVTTSVENLNEENPAATFAATLNSKAIKARALENLKINWPESKLDSKLSLTPIANSPIVYNINIGHSTPRCIIPFGVEAEVNISRQTISFNY